VIAGASVTASSMIAGPGFFGRMELGGRKNWSFWTYNVHFRRKNWSS
jgi:hypothetical protein